MLTKRSKVRTYFFIFLLLVLVGALIYFLWFWSGFKITKINIEGEKLVDIQELKAVLFSLLGDRAFYFLPQDKIFIFPTGKIKEKLLAKFSEIKEINLKRELPDTLFLKLEEREKTGIWCFKETNNCFYFDKEGVIFHPAPLMMSSLTLSIFSSSQEKPILGQQLLESRDIEKIFQIKELCKQKANLDLVSLENYSPNSFDFEFISRPGWRIFFNTNEELEEQVYVLVQTLEKEIGESQSNLDYIDLRVKNRAYYKYRE